jgi:hypothetical protein
VSYAVLLVMVVRFSRRFFVWRFPYWSLCRVAVASAVMGLVVRDLEHRLDLPPLWMLMACACAGAVVCLVVLLALGEFSPGELKAVRRVVQRLLRVKPSVTDAAEDT